jgi:flagellar hook protein FlgE
MNPLSNTPDAFWASRWHVLLVPVMACLLAACGGGGGGDEVTAVVEPLLATPGRATAQQTGQQLDLAIAGDGMFTFIDAQGRTQYSRSAHLGLDLQNRLVNPDGAWLAGELEGTAKPGELQALPALPMTLPARASRLLKIDVNLQGCKPGAIDTSWWQWQPRLLPALPLTSGFVPAFSGLQGAQGPLRRICPEDTTPFVDGPSSGAQFSFATQIFDDEGRPRNFKLYFRGMGTHAWQVFATVDDELLGSSDVVDGSPAGVLRFDSETGAPDPSTTRMAIVLPARAADQAGAPLTMELDLSGSTQYEAPFGLIAFDHDGYTAGTLAQVGIDERGQIRLRYSNWQERAHGRLLLARFSVADRMRAVGQGSWLCEVQCAGARIATPTTQLTGSVLAGYLEPTLRPDERPGSQPSTLSADVRASRVTASPEI